MRTVMMNVPDTYTIKEEDVVSDIGKIVLLLPKWGGNNCILVTSISTDSRQPKTILNNLCKNLHLLLHLNHSQK